MNKCEMDNELKDFDENQEVWGYDENGEAKPIRGFWVARVNGHDIIMPSF